MNKVAIFAMLLLLACPLSGCGEKGESSLRETRLLMGTTVTVEASGEGDVSGAVAAAFSEMGRLEKIFSRYDPESELSRLNALGPGRAVPVSPEMSAALSVARRMGRATSGAFDITVGPLLELWGFFPGPGENVPVPEEIAAARARIGWDKIALDPAAGTLTKLAAGVELDLGGIVKGWIADRGLLQLRARGMKSGLINAGGDIACLGERPGGGAWRIGVEDPRREGKLLLTLEVRDGAVATSGDYRNFFIRSRRRYSHIMDPRTAAPSLSGVVEVSVLAENCATADGLATGIFVLGAEAGIALLDSLPGVEGLIVTEREGEIGVHLSRGLAVASVP